MKTTIFTTLLALLLAGPALGKTPVEFSQEPGQQSVAQHSGHQSTLQTIFQKCDMTGPAHDNLHTYLMPLIGQVDSLSEQHSPKAVKDLVAGIKAHLVAFKDYFV